MNASKFLSVSLITAAMAASAQAVTVSVNLAISTNDNNSVDADETAVVGIPGATATGGANWNHIQLRASGTGVPDASFFTATQGGNFINLKDDNGNVAAARFTTTSAAGGFFTSFSDTTDGGNRGLFGEAGLMQSYINVGATESLNVTNLGSEFTANGYKVLVFFEIGFNGTAPEDRRVYSILLDDGSVQQVVWTDDLASTDSDANDDGFIEWVQAVGLTEGTATINGNYAVFEGLTSSSFSLSSILGTTTGGRNIISGFQIVANVIPEPATAGLLLIGGAAMLRRRRAVR